MHPNVMVHMEYSGDDRYSNHAYGLTLSVIVGLVGLGNQRADKDA